MNTTVYGGDMSKRKRNIRKTATFTAEEYSVVQEKMVAAQSGNFTLFAREMLLTGTVKHYDFGELRAISRELARLAGSINQIAKRCNETRNLHETDVRVLQREYMEVKSQVQEQLCKLLRKI